LLLKEDQDSLGTFCTWTTVDNKAELN